MVLSVSEFDGGKRSVVRPDEAVDRGWSGTLEAVSQKSSCVGKVAIGPVLSKGTANEDIREVPYTSICGKEWFSVEVHAKADGHRYPALYIFDRNHNLIVEYDDQLSEKMGPGFVEGRDAIVHDSRYEAHYRAELPDDSGLTAEVYIGLVTHGGRLADVSIEAGNTHVNAVSTETRWENPRIDMQAAASDDGRWKGVGYRSFSEDPNVLLLVNSW